MTDGEIINRQKAEIEKLNIELKAMRGSANSYKAEIERLRTQQSELISEYKNIAIDAIKNFGKKITEVFMRYAHLHTYADKARRDTIETFDLTEIEMQSVWDVLTLKKNEMAGYEEMSRLQDNIETIAKERLLTELEKDFRLLVKEMTEE